MTTTSSKKAPPPLAGRRSVQRALMTGSTSAGSVQYSMGLTISNGDFVVTASVVNGSGQITVGDDDFIGIYANQAALNKDIADVNGGGSGGAYLDWEWVTHFTLSGSTLTWNSSQAGSSSAVLGYFAKDYVSGNYRFVGQITTS